MPMKYDPVTGIPSYDPGLGEEIDEGVTPLPVAHILYNKTDPFKGDPPLSLKEMREQFPAKHTIKITRPIPVPTTTIEHMADKMLDDVVRKARPARLDNTFTTDEELQDLARQVEDRTIANWPMLRRLLNRLLRAEGK